MTDQDIKDIHVQNGIICKNCKHFVTYYWKHFTNGKVSGCLLNPFGRGREEDEYCDLWEKKEDDAETGI